MRTVTAGFIFDNLSLLKLSRIKKNRGGRGINRYPYNTHSYIKYGIYIVKTFKWKSDRIYTIIPRSFMINSTYKE